MEQEKNIRASVLTNESELYFTVDVLKERYDFASDSFAHLFGYNPTWIKTIRQQGDLLEERIHPDDRMQLTECQIEHGQFIYSLPPEERNDYRQIFQFRMLNARQQYINVSSRQQVIETDRNGKAWIIMGVMDILPDQTPIERIKRTVVNRKRERCFQHALFLPINNYPTGRKKYYDSSDKVF